MTTKGIQVWRIVSSMLLDEFDYELPKELIAQEPSMRRVDSRLMVVRPMCPGRFEHTTFGDIGAYLRQGDVLVINDVRVQRARIGARKLMSGGQVELLLVSRLDACTWSAMVKPSRRLSPGTRVVVDDGSVVVVGERLAQGRRRVHFSSPGEDVRIMATVGRLPLPPYVHDHDRVEEDRYQTVYARSGSAVAAPTAGLHFTEDLMKTLETNGVEIARVTLDVGPGTFLPLRHRVVEENTLHRESFHVGREAAESIDGALKEGRRIIAVGTTSLRVLESLGPRGFAQGAYEGSTDIFLRPGIPIRVAQGLVTNFHLPGTSLLCLVGAVAGMEAMREAYAEAIRLRYRFYSFGDAMLIIS